MKKRMYKFVELGDQDTRYEIFMAVEILNESQLRKIFAEKIAVIDERLLADYGLTQQSKNFDNLGIGEIIDILNDVSNFNAYSYYLVEEIDVEL